MAFITWGKQYSVGVKVLDEQHYKLVEMANILYEAIKSGQGNKALVETFKGLVDYVHVHFTAEEALLEKNEYPFHLLLKHKQEHSDLINKVKEIYSNALSGSYIVSYEMLNFLRDWLLHHIAESDKKYEGFFNNLGIY